jgi:hypothetical protein
MWHTFLKILYFGLIVVLLMAAFIRYALGPDDLSDPQRMMNERYDNVASTICSYKEKCGVMPQYTGTVLKGCDDCYADKQCYTFLGSFSLIRGDRWGRDVEYIVTGNTVRFTSYGSDGKPGGVGLKADISRTVVCE